MGQYSRMDARSNLDLLKLNMEAISNRIKIGGENLMMSFGTLKYKNSNHDINIINAPICASLIMYFENWPLALYCRDVSELISCIIQKLNSWYIKIHPRTIISKLYHTLFVDEWWRYRIIYGWLWVVLFIKVTIFKIMIRK